MKIYEKNDNAVIGLCGKKGTGKTTIANILVNCFGFQRRYAFATPLKKMVEALCDEAGVEKPEKEKPIEVFGGKTMRELYQTLGTEWGRNLIDGNLWVKILSKNLTEDFEHWKAIGHEKYDFRMSLHGPSSFRAVVEDVRFPNEASYIQKGVRSDSNDAISGYVIQVINPSVKDNEFSDHISEKLFDEFLPDEVIDNDSSTECLAEELRYLLPREWYFQEGD